MFTCLDNDTEPMETFYDGYIVNTIIDACYRSAETRQWETIELDIWQGDEGVEHVRAITELDGKIVIKTEVMPDGRTKQILKDAESGEISEQLL